MSSGCAEPEAQKVLAAASQTRDSKPGYIAQQSTLGRPLDQSIERIFTRTGLLEACRQ